MSLGKTNDMGQKREGPVMRRVSFLISGILLGFSLWAPGSAWTEDYSLKTMTPQVKAALDARRDRYHEIQQLKQEGLIGENNRGYLELLKPSSAAAKAVEAENKDRRLIYQTIADQNGLKDSLDIIEKTFAEVRREKALAGEWIQLPSGEWVQKKAGS